MNKENIKKNLTYSGILCILCLFLAGVCLWLRILELAAALGCLALFEGLIFGIWYKRYKRSLRKEDQSPFKFRKP